MFLFFQESVSFIEWVKRREDQFNGSMVEPFLCEARRYQLIVRYAHVGLLLAARSDREDLRSEVP